MVQARSFLESDGSRVVPISNKPFRSLLESLEEVFVEVLQIVVLCKGQVSQRMIGGRMISC